MNFTEFDDEGFVATAGIRGLRKGVLATQQNESIRCFTRAGGTDSDSKRKKQISKRLRNIPPKDKRWLPEEHRPARVVETLKSDEEYILPDVEDLLTEEEKRIWTNIVDDAAAQNYELVLNLTPAVDEENA